MSFSERRQLKLIERCSRALTNSVHALEQLAARVQSDLERKEDDAAARKLQRLSKRVKRG